MTRRRKKRTMRTRKIRMAAIKEKLEEKTATKSISRGQVQMISQTLRKN